MKNFIESEVLSLIDMGRKQIRKEKMYDQFLKTQNVTTKEVPETEFVEIVEQIGKTSDNFRTTQKLIKLTY